MNHTVYELRELWRVAHSLPFLAMDDAACGLASASGVVAVAAMEAGSRGSVGGCGLALFEAGRLGSSVELAARHARMRRVC